jgi:hypothetical protein
VSGVPAAVIGAGRTEEREGKRAAHDVRNRTPLLIGDREAARQQNTSRRVAAGFPGGEQLASPGIETQEQPGMDAIDLKDLNEWCRYGLIPAVVLLFCLAAGIVSEGKHGQ